MSIYSYQNFQILLEAKIQFLNNLKSVLNKMDHPLAKKILSLEDQDLDININYFNSKDVDYLSFYQDNKIKSWVYIISDNGGILYLPEVEKKLSGKFTLDAYSGQEGVIEDDVDPELIKKYYPQYKIERIVILQTENGRVLVDAKYLEPSKPFGTEQSGKIGRTFKTLLHSAGYEANAKEIEELVNNYKKVVSDKSINMDLVSGENIRKYYLDKNGTSLKKGTLAGSCMRYAYCQEYLDLYTQNSNVQCLILRSPNESDKIMARALVWKLNNGKYFMDRVYYTHDYEVGLFTDYAKEKGWIYKEAQGSLPTGLKLGDSDYLETLIVDLENVDFSYYPYLDTLKWMDMGKKTISNVSNGTFPLESTEGELGVGCDFCGGSGEVDCPECNGSDEDCYFCHGDNQVPCPDCG